MRSDATTVAQYLDELSDQRRQAIAAVRETIVAHLPVGYEEAMNWGMISYQVPLQRCPDTYNGQPLMYAALAAQKNYMAVYLTGVYMDEGGRAAFAEAYQATGKRLDMGKSCVRFKRLDDLPLELIGQSIAAWPVDDFVAGVAKARDSA
ncbi:MAG: DUF1801 domain-containing protein [Candidatus Latescibacteria bacterium]|nr:DUF1801 domain-containing protein [Candidatus Latescibacterota bacterium]